MSLPALMLYSKCMVHYIFYIIENALKIKPTKPKGGLLPSVFLLPSFRSYLEFLYNPF